MGEPAVPRYRNPGNVAAVIIAVLSASFTCSSLAKDPKLSEQEVVSQHIESIGPSEVLAGVRFRVARGACTVLGRVFAQTGGEEEGPFAGEATFMTGPSRIQFTIVFPNQSHLAEGFIFDGKQVRLVAFESPRLSGLSEAKTNLGSLSGYFPRWQNYIEAGLFGGVLNAHWPLLSMEEALKELESLKPTKIGDRELLALRFRLVGTRGAELFFEPETFRHVASRFRLVRGAYHSDSGERVTLREEFSDFREFDGLQLPTRWTIILEESRRTPSWKMMFFSIRNFDEPELNRPAN